MESKRLHKTRFTFAIIRAALGYAEAWRKRRIRAQLHVCVTPAGISYLAGPRRKWRVEWTEVAGVEHGHGELVLYQAR